jgi:RNA polymerase sigma-70 factor, ECF subfamily
LAAAQRGDTGALDAFLRCHYDRILQICRRITGNDADAADATQEAMLAIVRGLPRFDGRSSITTWLYRVTTNACLDELRRRKRRPAVGLPDLERFDRPTAGVAHDEGLADRLRLDAALAALPEEFRVPVVLRDVGDLDYADIALVLDIPAGTVRSRIARGRMALARSLGTDTGNQTGTSQRQTDGS